MAQKRGGPQRKTSSSSGARENRRGRATAGKVGSDPNAPVGGKLDFGIPASQVKAPLSDGGREKGVEQGTGPMRSGNRAVRTSGVGHPPGRAGTGSGGDIDTDVVGLGGRGGVAASPASGRTSGPDITEGGSAPFASGPPARGKNQRRPGAHGTAQRVRGSTVDRTGGDASTTGPETNALNH